MATLHAFDTLAYTKALVDRGYERDKAEALAEAQREFFVKELASEDFVSAEIDKAKTELKVEIDKVRSEIDKLRTELKAEIKVEIKAVENRLIQTTGKMLAFAVGVMLAGIPIIQALLAKLG